MRKNRFPPGLYLAFDYGMRSIGIASGQSYTKTASPLSIVTNYSGTPNWNAIKKLMDDWSPVGLVVGIPLLLDGKEQSLTGHARGFKKKLAQQFNLPVFEADERLTTRLASHIIRKNRQCGNRHKTSKADLDKIAAALILETWFETVDEFN